MSPRDVPLGELGTTRDDPGRLVKRGRMGGSRLADVMMELRYTQPPYVPRQPRDRKLRFKELRKSMPSRPNGPIHFRSRAPGQATLQTQELEDRNEDSEDRPSILSRKRPASPSFEHAANQRKARPSQGNSVLSRVMAPNQPDIARQVGEQALDSGSGSEVNPVWATSPVGP